VLRGIFLAPGITQDQADIYANLFKKVRETPEWVDFMEKGAFKQTFMSGKEFADWVGKTEAMHYGLMKDAGFLAK